jgi:hypothetical protein
MKAWEYSSICGWYRIIQIMPTSRKMLVHFKPGKPDG